MNISIGTALKNFNQIKGIVYHNDKKVSSKDLKRILQLGYLKGYESISDIPNDEIELIISNNPNRGQ